MLILFTAVIKTILIAIVHVFMFECNNHYLIHDRFGYRRAFCSAACVSGVIPCSHVHTFDARVRQASIGRWSHQGHDSREHYDVRLSEADERRLDLRFRWVKGSIIERRCKATRKCAEQRNLSGPRILNL
jgi:hypothetical protein